MISTISPTMQTGQAGTIQPGIVVFPTRFAAFSGPAILVGREHLRYLVWPNDGVQLEEVEFDQPLLTISEAAHLDIDVRTQFSFRKTETEPRPGMIVLASGGHDPLLVVSGLRHRNAAVSMTTWTVGGLPSFIDIGFTKWSVWPRSTLGGVDDHPFFEVSAA